jgi:HEAT repeat protein
MRLSLSIPKLRMWHLLGIVAASAAFISAIQFRWTTEDEGYALVRRLYSGSAQERTKAARGLSYYRPRERRAIAPLTEMLFDLDAKARAAAAETLLVIVGKNSRGISDFDEAEIGPVKAALASALADPDPVARLAIARTLGNLGTEPKVIVPTLLEFASDRNDRTRLEAVSILGSYARRSEPAMAAVFAAMDDPNAQVRWSALNGMAYFAVVPDTALEPLLTRIKDAIASKSDDPDRNVRLSSIWALSRISQRLKMEDPRIIRFLSDPNFELRASAWDAVAFFPNWKRAPELIPTLERFLSDPDPSVRSMAALKIGGFGLLAEPAMPTLQTLVDDQDRSVRAAAAGSIAMIEKTGRDFREETLPKAVAELADADPITRALAASRIEDFGPRASAAVPSLVKCLADPEADVRRASADALGQLGPEAAVAIPTLSELARSDSDERVRQAATFSQAILLRQGVGKR